MTWYITGISRGLGYALAQQLLDRGEQVIGIGRSCPFNHPALRFIPCDFSQLDEVNSLDFPEIDGPITLINNAGILGEIGRISALKSDNFQEVMTVNATAPFLLTKKLYQKLQQPEHFCLVNISSGAARRSIPSWAAYCASKAALDRWTENFYLEELELGRRLKVYALAPGVIDTDMQAQIRAIDPQDFSAHERFVELKSTESLYLPEYAASLLLDLLNQPHQGEVLVDLRTK